MTQDYITLLTLLVAFGSPCLGMKVLEKTADIPKRVDKSQIVKLIEKQQDPQCIELAQELLEKIYECKPRRTMTKDGSARFGIVYPVNPEVLADLMTFSRGKTVLELAAGSGENGILLGLAGAKHVTINDIEPLEISQCRNYIERVPEELQDVFTVSEGDCFTVFESDDYTEQFDVIYARNILHFFAGQKRERFVQMLDRLLAPGGRLVVSVNSALHALEKKVLTKNPDAYIFKKQELLYLDTYHDTVSSFDIQVTLEKNPRDVDPLQFEHVPVLEFIPEGAKQYPKCMNRLSKRLQGSVMAEATKLLKKYGPDILTRWEAGIYFHESPMTAYTRTTIKQAFAKTKLICTNTLSIDGKGHIVGKKKEFALNAIFKK